MSRSNLRKQKPKEIHCMGWRVQGPVDKLPTVQGTITEIMWLCASRGGKKRMYQYIWGTKHNSDGTSWLSHYRRLKASAVVFVWRQWAENNLEHHDTNAFGDKYSEEWGWFREISKTKSDQNNTHLLHGIPHSYLMYGNKVKLLAPNDTASTETLLHWAPPAQWDQRDVGKHIICIQLQWTGFLMTAWKIFWGSFCWWFFGGEYVSVFYFVFVFAWLICLVWLVCLVFVKRRPCLWGSSALSLLFVDICKYSPRRHKNTPT